MSNFLPITFGDHKAFPERKEIHFYRVVFDNDLGPFVRGERVDCLYVSHETKTIWTVDKNGQVAKETKFRGPKR